MQAPLKKGQLLPASGRPEQNVSSVPTSAPSAVLVHIKTRLLFFFPFAYFAFVVNSHCISVFFSLSLRISGCRLNRSHIVVIKDFKL